MRPGLRVTKAILVQRELQVQPELKVIQALQVQLVKMDSMAETASMVRMV